MRVDLRSDTLTQPTPGMREALAAAVVGDDVFGEDPTVIRLEQQLAQNFGMEAGLFCPSGTMTNQIAIRAQTQPQDQVICDITAHMHLYEGGGLAYNSMVSTALVQGDRGRFRGEQVEEQVLPDDVHFPHSQLVIAENTVNKGGGCVFPLSSLQEIRKVCDRYHLKFHLDGARIFNAITAAGTRPSDYGKIFDTISVCLSKGLGAPVGSVLVGNKETIDRARRIRKVLGGGMRQAGILAAAGLYALENQVDRLKNDHQRARQLGRWMESLPWIGEVLPVETNIVVCHLAEGFRVSTVLEALRANGILAVPFGKNQIRMVTHLDIGDDHLQFLEKNLPEINVSKD